MRARIAVAWLAVAGCVDPGAKLDAFHARELAALERDAGSDSSDDETGTGLPTPEQIEGDYLYIVSTVLSPRKPIISYLQVKAVQKGGGLELTMRDRPLSAYDRKTPVGPYGPWRKSMVQPNGRYETESIRVITPGDADAVQLGVESESKLVFRGQVPRASELPGGPDARVDFWCGKADGVLVRPIEQSLDGSTFTAMRVVDSKPYPSPVINCAMDPAEPL